MLIANNIKKNLKKYNCTTLRGVDVSQIISRWPHKSVARFQFKLPEDISELYQLVKIAWSLGSIAPIWFFFFFFFQVKNKSNENENEKSKLQG